MITRLFRSKKRLDGAEPRERLAAIAALTEEEVTAGQATLGALARDDPDLAVRRAAISRIATAQPLAGLLDDPDVGADAARRAAELVGPGSSPAIAGHPAVLQARLAISADPALLDEIAALGDPALLVEAVLASPRPERARLLDRFNSAALLGELERGTRDRDKALNRHARGRLETLKQLRQSARSQAGRAAELLDALEDTGAGHAIDPSTEPARRAALVNELDSTFSALADSARSLAAFDETLDSLTGLEARRAAVSSALAAESAAREEAAAAASTPPAAAAADTAAGLPVSAEAFEPLTARLRELAEQLRAGGDPAGLEITRQQLSASWIAATAQQQPEPDQQAMLDALNADFRQLAEAGARLAELEPVSLADALGTVTPEQQASPAGSAVELPGRAEQQLLRGAVKSANAYLTRLAWPAWAKPPEPIAALTRQLEQARAVLSGWDAQLTDRQAELSAMLETLAGQITAGELRGAQRSADDVRRGLDVLPDHLGSELARRLAREQGRLAELKDWQTFATGPKREALCDRMAQLAAKPLPPADQAHRIKSLRAEWNELGPVTRAADHKLLTRFNELAEDAFKPCREHFAAQAELRAGNLTAREQICQQLESYLSSTAWPDADYKAAEQIIRTAREEWRRFHPVDRRAGKPLEQRFEKLQDALHDHIKAEWERNLAAKRAIVAEAQALATGEAEPPSRVEAAKALQQRWQRVGVTPRRPDQQLWQEFRAACDAVFQARDQAVRQADEALQASLNATREVVDGLAAAVAELAAGTEPDPAQLRDFRNRFAEREPLPERLQRPLDQEFSRLVKSYRLAIEEQRQIERRAELAALADHDRTVAAQEAAHRRGEQVAFEPPVPVFAGRWESVDEEVPSESLNRLAIEAEIAAGLESPPEDRDLRLAVQVDLMNSGRGREALEAEALPLAERWCRLGPKDDSCKPLRERFFNAISVLDQR